MEIFLHLSPRNFCEARSCNYRKNLWGCPSSILASLTAHTCMLCIRTALHYSFCIHKFVLFSTNLALCSCRRNLGFFVFQGNWILPSQRRPGFFWYASCQHKTFSNLAHCFCHRQPCFFEINISQPLLRFYFALTKIFSVFYKFYLCFELLPIKNSTLTQKNLDADIFATLASQSTHGPAQLFQRELFWIWIKPCAHPHPSPTLPRFRG